MTFVEPTNKQANQYATYLAKVGKFRIRSFNPDKLPRQVKTLLWVSERLGWDINGITGLVAYDTMYVKNWASLSPIKKVSLLNHESKHIGQGRETGWSKWYWRYFTDKDYRCAWEMVAYYRTLETRYMFGYSQAQMKNLIKNLAEKMKGPYFLDQKHTNKVYYHFSVILKRLLTNTHQNDSALFWQNFLDSAGKRSLNL